MSVFETIRYFKQVGCLLAFLALVITTKGQGNATPVQRLNALSQPSDSDISGTRIFDEPLIPFGNQISDRENRALAVALNQYASRSSSDDFSALTAYLNAHPRSRWHVSLLIQLGTEYYNTGYYSKALSSWEEAWIQCKGKPYSTEKALVGRALGELAQMYSKLGRMADLETLLEETKGMDLSGPGTQMVKSAREALWMMKNRPEVSFRCGPLALGRILAFKEPGTSVHPLVHLSKSTTNGFALSQVVELSQQLNLDYQMAFRSPGAALITPAVVHWKSGHYAAVIRKEQNRFLVEDHTFHSSLWMTTAALDDEGSGYFLVPAGALPNGWRPVPAEEGQNVWGKGIVTTVDKNATSPYDVRTGGKCGDSTGMATYAMNTLLASLSLQDTPVEYSPPVGPAIRFTATYNHLEANQPTTFYYSNLGPKWTCNWIAYIVDNPSSPNANVLFYVDGGGSLIFSGYNSTTKTYAVELMSQGQLTKVSSSSYELLYPDGSKKTFALSDGSIGTVRRIFLTRITDPAGNFVQLNYDGQFRITSIVDAIGQSTTLLYSNSTYPFAITKVIDPFGRFALFQYNASGLLEQITDVLGLTSRFVYGSDNFITSLITPYGTTTFSTQTASGETTLQATDPLGGTETLLYSQNQYIAASEPASVIPRGMAAFNSFLYGRNSYFWDKKAYADGRGDATKATIYHWLHSADGAASSRVLESIKKPLENRVWFNYPGQSTNSPLNSGYNYSYLGAAYLGTNSQPSLVGRVLEDGTTQIYAYKYNPSGLVTNVVDPVGRTFSYVYTDNGQDLKEVRMTRNGKNELMTRVAYNTQHLPVSVTDSSGQTTINTYNSRGQILSTTNPKGEVTGFSYDANGYLLAITNALQTAAGVTRFTYDSFGRVRTTRDTEGYTLTFDYDAMDRATKITYPDSTFEQFVYDRLDMVAFSDRQGRWTTNTFNALQQLVQIRDPLGRITTYDWCRCGALSSLIDPMGRATTWFYDVQSRPTAKQYADGSIVSYLYESTSSRLKSKFDEKGQQTFYEYYADNSLKRRSYPNATVATPTVSFTYDPDYSRVLTMQDGVGTSTYTYYPITATPSLGAGRVASISGPLPNSIATYQYDALGRATNSVQNGITQSVAYDVLGRASTEKNALGTFGYTYLNATPRLTAESYPNGQSIQYTYYDNIGDQRLRQIRNFKPGGALLSSFGYSYKTSGQIASWTNEWDSLPTRIWSPQYDAARQLTNVNVTGTSQVITNFAYGYDLSGNRTAASTNKSNTAFFFNALNQLTDSQQIFSAAISYEWDAENRLTAIIQGTKRSEFTYDGLGRRVRIVEKTNGTITSDDYYIWCGNTLSEQRSTVNGTATRRFYARGEQQIASGGVTTSLFYTRDHLGSVREALDGNGVLAARYDYDPFGRQTVLQESFRPTFGFTGHLIHAPSRLYLTLYRAYDSSTGRWLSRDPMEEKAGINLYQYVFNDPILLYDPLGLEVGLGESLIPIWGSGREAYEAFQCGHYWKGALYTGLAISDVFLVKALFTGLGKVAIISLSKEVVEGISKEAAEQIATQPNRINSARELIRRAEEPGAFHNFPESFNQHIFNQGEREVTPNFFKNSKTGLTQDGVMYKLQGSVNGVNGTFEIGVRPSISGNTEVIQHRFFRPDRP